MEFDENSLPKVIDEAAFVLAKCVVPLYESDIRDRPSSHGSGFFVKTDRHHFLVSAAHVLETLAKRPLFYYVTPNTTRKLSGKVVFNPWQGDRENDPIDVGILHLEGEELPPYPQVNKFALDISHLRPTFLPRSERRYMVLGFPASRSNANPMKREMAATLYGYHADSIEDLRYSELGLSSETHVALPLDLEVGFDSTGKRRNFPKPQGMSGSPVWVLYNYNVDPRNDLGLIPIVAVATKYRKRERLLVGTDISVVLRMISDFLRSGLT